MSLTSATLKYQGRSLSRNKDREEYIQTWQGNEQAIDGLISTLTIGNLVQGKGYIYSYNKACDQGPIWNLQITYTTDLNSTGISFTTSDEYGYHNDTLSVRSIQLPLQHLSGYHICWNWYLIGKCASGETLDIPNWWTSAGYNFIMPDEDIDKYRLVKSASEVPIEWEKQEITTNDTPSTVLYKWRILANPTKPGVEYYDHEMFVLTRVTKYPSRQAAGQAIAKNINTVTNRLSSAFNISGGNWKYDSAQVNYDGNSWRSVETWTRSGDNEGWDPDLYKTNN